MLKQIKDLTLLSEQVRFLQMSFKINQISKINEPVKRTCKILYHIPSKIQNLLIAFDPSITKTTKLRRKVKPRISQYLPISYASIST